MSTHSNYISSSGARRGRGIVAGAIVASLALALTGCGGTSSTEPAPDITLPAEVVDGFTVPAASDKGGEDNPVRIGVVGASNPQFQVLQDAALAEGIHLEYQDFTDYAQPNPALSAGELDLNQFQHIIYLAQYNIDAGDDLVPIGATAIYPIGLYSKEYTSPATIPDGATIVVPDDQTNQARGLQVLQSAGLIQIHSGASPLFSQVSDIDEAASRVTVTAVAADQTARSLDDPSIAGAIINNDYITQAGLSAHDAIAQDDPDSSAAAPFINIWVSRPDEADSPVYAEIIRLAHSKEWSDALQENSDGTAVLIDQTPAQLQATLDDVEQQLRDNA
ncbi:MAG: methionine ABC transporter substrate-binding protein [Propionibacteriaceae bacterium]|jgi:D-methionine transport system substrate-binding protein|nr:methionine ABC transporter substrate-binding protein [Propionibacteriaceae bacterium]